MDGLGHIELGNSARPPLVFFHGYPAAAQQVMAVPDLGVFDRFRLIAVDRPGFGDSAPAGDGAELIARFRQLLETLMIDKFHIVAVSAGAGTAFVLADRLRDRVMSLTSISSLGPLDERELFDSLPTMVRWIFTLARTSPVVARPALRVAAQSIRPGTTGFPIPAIWRRSFRRGTGPHCSIPGFSGRCAPRGGTPSSRAPWRWRAKRAGCSSIGRSPIGDFRSPSGCSTAAPTPGAARPRRMAPPPHRRKPARHRAGRRPLFLADVAAGGNSRGDRMKRGRRQCAGSRLRKTAQRGNARNTWRKWPPHVEKTPPRTRSPQRYCFPWPPTALRRSRTK